MSQTQWTRITGYDSTVEPALAVGPDERLTVVAITPAGEVVASSSRSCADGWDAWAVVNGVPGRSALAADPGTPPVLVRDGSVLHLFCRGADDNLHHAERPSGAGWLPWRQLTTDGSVRGRISVAFTTAGGTCAHVAYGAPGDVVRSQRYTDGWLLAEPTRSWPNAVDAVQASDGACEVLLVIRSDRNRMIVQRRAAPWTSPWTSVAERDGCIGLSNCVFFAGAFHLASLVRTVLDDVSGSSDNRVIHSRFRAGQYDDAYLRVMHVYQPQRGSHPHVTLGVYRGKLIAAFGDERLAVRAAYLDTADPATPWIDLGAVAGGRTAHPPALAAFDGRSALTATGFDKANYGDDLFAAVRGGTTGGVWVANFSRAAFPNRLQQIEAGVDWCTNYSGPRTMANCPSIANPPAITELPVYSEVGFGTMTLPDWLVRPLFARTLRNAKDAGPYYTWIHTQQMTPYFGPHLNIDFTADYLAWHEEMGHRVASSIGIWDVGATKVNPNLMRDLLPDRLVADATTLFGTGTNATGKCNSGTASGGRCRGFTGIAGNYDMTSVQHAWIYVIYFYLSNADELRRLAYDDLRAGDDLLKRKYDWVREHIFRGVEFASGGTPLSVALLRNVHSGKVLDVAGWDVQDHAVVQQFSGHGGDNQHWALRRDGEGFVELTAMHSGKCLDVAALSQENGAAVQLYASHGGVNQKWALIPDGKGCFEIVAKHSGKCLEVAGWSTSDGATVQQYARHGGDNQKWRLEFTTSF